MSEQRDEDGRVGRLPRRLERRAEVPRPLPRADQDIGDGDVERVLHGLAHAVEQRVERQARRGLGQRRLDLVGFRPCGAALAPSRSETVVAPASSTLPSVSVAVFSVLHQRDPPVSWAVPTR